MNVYRRHYHRIKVLYTQFSEKRISGHKPHSIIHSCVFGFVNHSITLLGLLFFFLDWLSWDTRQPEISPVSRQPRDPIDYGKSGI